MYFAGERGVKGEKGNQVDSQFEMALLQTTLREWENRMAIHLSKF